MDFQDPQLIKAEIERRRYRRAKVAAQVHCEALERKEVMVTRHVSIGGMFIDAKFPLPIESELTVTFRLDPTGPPVTCNAKVMFSRVNTGMGIQFVDLTAEARQLIQEFVDEVA